VPETSLGRGFDGARFLISQEVPLLSGELPDRFQQLVSPVAVPLLYFHQ
jgi:hypothetical protein